MWSQFPYRKFYEEHFEPKIIPIGLIVAEIFWKTCTENDIFNFPSSHLSEIFNWNVNLSLLRSHFLYRKFYEEHFEPKIIPIGLIVAEICLETGTKNDIFNFPSSRLSEILSRNVNLKYFQSHLCYTKFNEAHFELIHFLLRFILATIFSNNLSETWKRYKI